MNKFLISLWVIFPIFAYLSIGYILRLLKIFDQSGADQINKSVFKLFLPIMIFCNIYNTDINTAFNFKLMLYAVISIICLCIISIFAVPLIEKDKKKIGVIIQMIFRSNFVIFGLPVASQLCGSSDLGAVSLLMAVIVPVFNVLAVVVLEMFRGGKINITKTLKGILTNPLIIASALGLIASGTSIKIPIRLYSIMGSLSSMATPLALIALGATFTFSSIKGYTKQIIIGISARLVVVPAIFIPIALMIGFKGIEIVALLTMYASPVAVSSYIMAKNLDGDATLAGHYVVLSAVASIFTVFMWIYFLKNMSII